MIWRAMGRLPGSRRRGAGEGGQSVVEFTLIVPVFLLLLLGLLEFGMAFTHEQTLAYATREGARTGAAAGDGSTLFPCNATTVTNFDAPIIAAVERVLTSPGSPIDMAQVNSISVYLARADGSETSGKVNIWTPATLATGPGPVVDGRALDFKQTTVGWDCLAPRNNGVNADGLGVSISYTYQFRTALIGIFRFMFGQSWSSLSLSDRTVMNLNPTN